MRALPLHLAALQPLCTPPPLPQVALPAPPCAALWTAVALLGGHLILNRFLRGEPPVGGSLDSSRASREPCGQW